MATSGVNSDLLQERSKATFDRNKLTKVIDGGDWFTDRRRYIESLVWEDEGYKSPTLSMLSRDEIYSEGVRKNMYMVKRIQELGLTETTDLYWYRSAIFPNEAMPSSLNTSMFIPTLMGQANADQQARWLQKAQKYEIIGTYAQTEMGHGTFLRGLETTATYDADREEFVLHSPTPTSIKWWPGGLGKTANFAVVVAKLIIGKKNHGVHSFIVQLRDLKTHKSLPGITVGDIGPKFGYDMIDNGFLKLNQARIPRDNMLMKNAQVMPDGTYVKASHDKLTYGTMVFVRALIVWDVCAKGLAQACTIAIRYSCVRHQSEMKPGEPEPQVLDFQSQQLKLFPQLAAAYAFIFAGTEIRNTYFMVNTEIQQGNVEQLPELHALSAGLKAVSSYRASSGMEVCRMACGGHGFSQASGIPKIYGNATPACTYEGENSVMLLQTARYLIKMNNQAKNGNGLPETVKYLAKSQQLHKCPINDQFKLSALCDTYRHRASRLVRMAAAKLNDLTRQGVAYHEAWNKCHLYLIHAALAHAELYIVENFAKKVEDLIEDGDEPGMNHALMRLCKLYAIHGILENAGDFLQDGFMSSWQLESCQAMFITLLEEIRPEAVTLVDAFDFHDNILQSVLGRYDGNVYSNLYAWALESPLNRSDVHPSFEKYTKPLRQFQSKL